MQISNNIFLYHVLIKEQNFNLKKNNFEDEFGSTLIWVNYDGRKNPYNKPILFIMSGIKENFQIHLYLISLIKD